MFVTFILAVLLSCYAVVDAALRRGVYWRLPAGLRVLFALALLGAAPFWAWPAQGGAHELRWFALALAGLLSWNAATRDHDPVAPGPSNRLRLGLVVSAAFVWFSPAFLLLTVGLLSGKFHFWQHHAAFPLRVLQALVAWVALASGLALLPDTALLPDLSQASFASLVLFLSILLVSHYVITALAKGFLGPRPWSWMLENRLHFLAASAYSWGWARAISWPKYRRVVELVRRVERPLQVLVFVLELSAPLALLDQRVTLGFCLAFAGFHVGVCALSGLLFWDWILTDLALFWLVWRLEPQIAGAAFGVVPFLVGCGVLVLFPLRHRLWTPMPLAWFDSPFTQRVHWLVTGASGRSYGLYNDFMCPHERLYGKVHACFVVPHAVLTYHLGQTYKLSLRDELVQAGPSLSKLARVRERYGIQPRSEELTLRHQQYLRAFFSALNCGTRKAVLPQWACWLKAPGEQLFYWGELPPYRRQEPVRSVRLAYREEYFDGRELVRLVDEELLCFDIPEIASDRSPEMSPRELDDYLLGLAVGRLIDLPGLGKGMLRADDEAGTRRASSFREAPAPKASLDARRSAS